MKRGLHNNSPRSGLILHVSRPVRIFLHRFAVAAVIFLTLFIVFLSKTDSPFTRSVKSQIMDVVMPVLYVVSMPANFVVNAHDSFVSYLFVHEKNENLVEQNKAMLKKLEQLGNLQVENRQLKKMLNFVNELEYSYITARLVSDASGPFNKSMMVDAGSMDGVKKGQVVVNEEGLIGRITDVSKHSARILLITDINSKVPVLSKESRERSILVGNNTNSPDLVYLPKDSQIKDGEQIVTSGDGDFFPPYVKIGKAHASDDGFYVTPYIKWHRVEYVNIINYAK